MISDSSLLSQYADLLLVDTTQKNLYMQHFKIKSSLGTCSFTLEAGFCLYFYRSDILT